MNNKPSVGISACLIGQAVRYNGRSKAAHKVVLMTISASHRWSIEVDQSALNDRQNRLAAAVLKPAKPCKTLSNKRQMTNTRANPCPDA